MEDVYKSPKSILVADGDSAVGGRFSPQSAIFISPLAAPLVWFSLVTILYLASTGVGFGGGLVGFLAVGLIVPLIVSYVLTILIGGPIYYLLFKFRLTNFWALNSITVLVVLSLGASLAILERELMGILIAAGVAIAALINTSFMWYLSCRPSSKQLKKRKILN